MQNPWRPWEREARPDAATEDPAPGIVQTMQAGFERVSARPYLIAVPLALDLALWFGPRLTSPALFNWLAGWPAQSETGADLAVALYERGRTAEIMTGVAQVWDWLGVQNLIGKVGRGAIPVPFDRPTTAIAPWFVALLIFFALLLVGLWLKSLFFAPVAQLLREEPFEIGANLRASLVGAGRVALLLLAVAGMVALTLVPVGLLAVALVLAGLDAYGLVLLAAALPVAYALFYGAYAMDAIYLEQVGPMRAAYLSYRVARRNIWPTLGFVTLTLAISRGVPLALSRVVQNPVGFVLAIVAHAYVAAGLAAGSLLFYRERRARVRDVRPEYERSGVAVQGRFASRPDKSGRE